MSTPICLTAKGVKVLKYTWRIGLGLLLLTPTLSSLVTKWQVGTMAEFVVGATCVGLLAFHLVNSRTRIRQKHWQDPELAKVLPLEIVLGIVFPAATLIAILTLPASSVMLILVAVAFVLAQSFYERLQKQIFSLVEANPNLEHGTKRFAERQPWRPLDDTIGDVAKDEQAALLQRLFTIWVGPPWRLRLSRTRTAILYMMIATAGLAFGAGVRETVRPPTQPGPASEKPRKEPRGTPHEKAGEDDSEPAGGIRSDRPPADFRASEEAGECAYLPGDGAPDWAEDHLNSLYLGSPRLEATPPPGFQVGGCTTGATVPPAGEGDFVYAVGKNAAGEVRSVAVDSLQFGPAIFLAPAAARVLHRIRDGQMPIGGYPTIDVAGGDMTVVLTPKGSAVLTRPSKHLPGHPDIASPYTEMPPPAASAWVAAMNERGAWLWPALPERRDGSEVFRLQGRASEGLPDLEVVLDRPSGVAVRDGWIYDPPESQLSFPELRHHASSAWWIRQETR